MIKQDLILLIQNYYVEHGKTPKQPTKSYDRFPSIYMFIKHFGSWNNALLAANVPQNMKTPEKSFFIQCTNCGSSFSIQPAVYFRSKNKHLFCSSNCSGTYNAKHNPKHYTQRSKIEKHIYNQLCSTFTDLIFIPNDRKTVGLELDIFLPELKLAFEVNGPLHYIPIHGKSLLQRKQKIDHKKSLLCEKQNIDLIILNISHINGLKERYKVQKIVNHAISIINNRL